MKNSKGDIEFEIIDDGLSKSTWNVSTNCTDEVSENVDNQKKMVITGSSTNTAVDEELADGIKEAEKLEKLSNKLNEYCKKNGIAENKAKQNNAADIFLENKERLECIKEQVGDVIKAEEDCKQNGTPFIDAYKEARKQSVKERIEELAETDGLRTENCSCGRNNKAEKTMAKMAIIYDFIDSLRDDLTIAEVKRRFF